jgi:2,4-dienoyl-CoA reductase-like NADH-dependent reductase (Old Yellow Enzyme family)
LAPFRVPTAAEAAAGRWFSPIALGPVRARTRTWVPAMVPWRASAEGYVTDAVVAWYERFARGWPGVIVLEATGIRDVASGPLLRIGDDRFVPGLRRVVEAVRRASEGRTKTFVQLIDFLAIRRRPTPEAYFGRFLAVTPRLRAALAERTGDPRYFTASEADVRGALSALAPAAARELLDAREREALDFGARERVGDLAVPHLRELPRTLPPLFAAAARRAREAGFDGVELHYAHAYTMASFLSRTNDRPDGYGGSRDGRLRLPRETYAAVRAATGADFAVGCRMLSDEAIPGGSDVSDAAHYAAAFAADGMDFVSLSRGGKFDDAAQPKIGEAAYPYTGPSGYECMPTIVSDERGPWLRQAELALKVRRAVRAAGPTTPVVAAGGVASFDHAEDLLARGAADVVASARQSLADPDWFRKLELGRGAEVRRCTFTNYCEALDRGHVEVTCKLWDRDFDRTAPPALSADGKRRLVAPPWAE